MHPENKEIAQIIFDSFKETFKFKDQGDLANNNPLRSSYFVSLIAEKLQTDFFSGSKKNVQAVQNAENKLKKEKGEWLYDICITAEISIEGTYEGMADINTDILIAGESEFDTSISGFAQDFGKLICSTANQYFYIQGINQKSEDGRLKFIENRKSIITEQLSSLVKDDFVLAFIPTPGKVGEHSFWDEYSNDIISWVSIWIYDKSKNNFIEYDK